MTNNGRGRVQRSSKSPPHSRPSNVYLNGRFRVGILESGLTALGLNQTAQTPIRGSWLKTGRLHRNPSVHQRYNFYTMNSFEFDAVKRESNRTKHGIDFAEAQSLWNDPMLLEIPAKTEDEPRFLVIGLIDGKHWSAVITYRGANIRLISVRRARTEEVALYES